MPSEPGTRRGRRAWLVAGAGAAAVLPAIWLVNRWVPPPKGLGATAGRLAACPDSPNCVNSQAADPVHRVEPLAFAGPAAAALGRLRDMVAAMPGATLVEAGEGYLRFEFRSTICRFVDDVEFVADEGAGVIQVRSASRIGYSDLGANRRRVEAIRARFRG